LALIFFWKAISSWFTIAIFEVSCVPWCIFRNVGFVCAWVLFYFEILLCCVVCETQSESVWERKSALRMYLSMSRHVRLCWSLFERVELWCVLISSMCYACACWFGLIFQNKKENTRAHQKLNPCVWSLLLLHGGVSFAVHFCVAITAIIRVFFFVFWLRYVMRLSFLLILLLGWCGCVLFVWKMCICSFNTDCLTLHMRYADASLLSQISPFASAFFCSLWVAGPRLKHALLFPDASWFCLHNIVGSVSQVFLFGDVPCSVELICAASIFNSFLIYFWCDMRVLVQALRRRCFTLEQEMVEIVHVQEQTFRAESWLRKSNWLKMAATTNLAKQTSIPSKSLALEVLVKYWASTVSWSFFVFQHVLLLNALLPGASRSISCLSSPLRTTSRVEVAQLLGSGELQHSTIAQ
jgi:hypothetical protein